MSDVSSAYQSGYQAGERGEAGECYADPSVDAAYQSGYTAGRTGMPDEPPGSMDWQVAQPTYDPNNQSQDTMEEYDGPPLPKPGDPDYDSEMPHGEYGEQPTEPGHWESGDRGGRHWVPDVEMDIEAE
jgi:hypothetical protein